MLEEVKNKHEQSYEKIIQPIATEVTTQYKELGCEHINKRISEEAREYKELMELLNIRLTNIDNKNIMLKSLLAEQEEIKRSLKQIDERADALPENMLSSSDVDKLLKDLQVTIYYIICLIILLYIATYVATELTYKCLSSSSYMCNQFQMPYSQKF